MDKAAMEKQAYLRADGAVQFTAHGAPLGEPARPAPDPWRCPACGQSTEHPLIVGHYLEANNTWHIAVRCDACHTETFISPEELAARAARQWLDLTVRRD